MSNTRRAAPGSEFAQEKFASSPVFERGLLGSMVALRCGKLEDPKHKELIWFIHFISHWGGGLKALAAALPINYPEHFGTVEMVKLGKRAGQSYNAEQVRKIRRELPKLKCGKFLLKDETLADVDSEERARISIRERGTWAAAHRRTMDKFNLTGCYDPEIQREENAAFAQGQSDLKAAAANNPSSYPVADFLSICSEAAVDDLEDAIRRLCLDPACELSNFQPWYFAGLVGALRDYFNEWTAERGEGLVKSIVTKKVWETIDYTASTGQMTLMIGVPRIGKSNGVESWYSLHPGKGRLVTVATGNDDKSFFMGWARDLGLGNLSQYKANEIRERVEAVLLAGDLVLLLDEGWRLFPQQGDPRFGFPKRLTWVMSMADRGVPICIISQPDFLRLLKSKEAQGWDSAQFVGRIKYVQLPDEVSNADLLAISAFHLPEADHQKHKLIAAYARKSLSYLGAIKTIAQDARYIARLDGRDSAGAQDVDRAMEENVIPSDSNLVRALEGKTKGKNKAANATAAELTQASREQSPVDETAPFAGPRRQQFEEVQTANQYT